MVDPTTTNTSMSVPIRGSDVGTWDTPVNGNFNSLDAMMGGVTTVALTSAAVTLTTSQALVNVIRFTGTLNSSVAVTLPGIYKSWTIDNQITNSPSSFCVTLVSTSGASIIGCPSGQQDVFYDGITVKYRNLGKLGEYWDYAAATVPSWVTGSTNKPYLNCDGSVISSATYAQLVNLLGTTTLPDARGRSRYAYGAATGRLTSSGAGIDGATVYAAGGSNGVTLGASQIPTITSSGTVTVNPVGSSLAKVPYLTAASSGTWSTLTAGAGSFNYLVYTGVLAQTSTFSGSNSMTYTNSSQAVVGNAAPGYVGGITMIRTGL